MNIVPNNLNELVSAWLALAPQEPPEDEFGCPWNLQKKRGMTPAQRLYQAQRNGDKRSSQVPSAPSSPALAQALGSGRDPLVFRNGVLTDTHLYMCLENGKLARRAILAPANIGEIFQLALTYRLAAIWIYPGTQVSAQAGEAFNVAAPEWGITKPVYNLDMQKQPTTTRFIGGYKKGEARAQGESGETVYVCYPEHSSIWGLTKRNEAGAWVSRLSSPGALLFTLAYTEDTLGFPLKYSPHACGRYVMGETNKGRRTAWIAPVDMRKFPVCCAENVKDLAWKRVLTPEESAQPWVLAYDKNSQYASACTGALLGSGEPIELHAPITFSTEKLVAGVWHCKISGTSIFDGVALPHPTDGKTEGYFWSYTVKLLIELGYTVEIDHAWIWRESHTILRPFAEKLWRSRAALGDRERYPVEEARAAANLLIKATMNQGIGSLNSRVYLSRGVQQWFRPDWREMLRDNARYQMFRRILKNHDAGYRLIGAHVDCLYYASPEKNHAKAIPNWLETVDESGEVKTRPGMGGYKPKYSADIPMNVARDWFNDSTITAGKLNDLLDAYCSEQAA